MSDENKDKKKEQFDDTDPFNFFKLAVDDESDKKGSDNKNNKPKVPLWSITGSTGSTVFS